jgi:hypothetical protein
VQQVGNVQADGGMYTRQRICAAWSAGRVRSPRFHLLRRHPGGEMPDMGGMDMLEDAFLRVRCEH